MGGSVEFNDMIWIQKWADRNPTVGQMLRKARREAVQEGEMNNMDEFCQAMDLGEPDPREHLIGAQDPITLAEWFTNRRKWFRGQD